MGCWLCWLFNIYGCRALGEASELGVIVLISLYTGTPGSGKSLHVIRTIKNRLQSGKSVIASFPVAVDKIETVGKRTLGQFDYWDYGVMTVQRLINYAQDNHVLGKESQTLVVIDECQILFNPREFSRGDRLQWITFFTQHRKLGYDFILITQFDRLIDRQIRSLIEYEYKHLKNNNNGLIGALLPVTLFSCKKYWYCVKEFIDAEAFFYNKKLASLYDSYMFFDESVSEISK